MKDASLTTGIIMLDAIQGGAVRFADSIGDIGHAWGLPRDACRVHAVIYLAPDGVEGARVARALSLDEEAMAAALAMLSEFGLIEVRAGGCLRAHTEPHEALFAGLQHRRSRDLPPMQAALAACRDDLARGGVPQAVAQIDKMLALVRDLSSLHIQAFRFSPAFLRGSIGFLGRAARLFGARPQ